MSNEAVVAMGRQEWAEPDAQAAYAGEGADAATEPDAQVARGEDVEAAAEPVQ